MRLIAIGYDEANDVLYFGRGDGNGKPKGITFDTNNNGAWTGSTSSVGSGTDFNVMNPYRAVYMWKRIS